MNNSKKLTELAQQCASITKEKGFFDVWHGNEIGLLKHNVLQQYGELAEAYEAKRKGKFYNGTFEKDTFEDELADVCIFGLSCLGYFEYENYLDILSEFKNYSLEDFYLQMMIDIRPHRCVEYVSELKKIDYLENIRYITEHLIHWCECKGIDIFMHIEQKMQYNAGREKLHGKKF